MSDSSINSRVSLLITYLKLNPNSFSVAAKVKPQTTNKILKGLNNPGYEYLYKVLSTFSYISAEWLMLGIGSIEKVVRETVKSSDNENKNYTLSKTIEILEETIKDKNGIIKDKERTIGDKVEIIGLLRSNIRALEEKLSTAVPGSTTKKAAKKHD